MEEVQKNHASGGLLRIATAGSVDDGKSTLIGRLMYDSKTIFEDQLEAMESSSMNRGLEEVNLALLTDGLKAEREQGITIDVAYRYFSTPLRKFIIADTPGHVQYTRNMVTGASTADLAMILIDARNGIVEQTYRHSYIASLLQIPHVVVCINKMDLVDFDRETFANIRESYLDFAEGLGLKDVTFIPMSALRGDNVVDTSADMPWYRGPSLLQYLESVEVDAHASRLLPARFPVQWVIRPQSRQYPDYRGFAGELASGMLRVGETVTVLPSGLSSRLKGIDTFDGPLEEAHPGQSVTLLLEDEIDISRGDMIVAAEAHPHALQEVDAMVCWLSEQPLKVGGRYALKHTTRETRAVVREVKHKVDVNTLKLSDDIAVGPNDIAEVRVKVMTPLFVDSYRENRATGSFILIDEATNATVGAGMVLPPKPPVEPPDFAI